MDFENDNDNNNLFGHIAGILTISTFLPQLVFMWQIKSAKDVSIMMLVINQISGIFWLLYALTTNNIILLIYNGFVDFINLLLIISKIYFDKYYKKEKVNISEGDNI